MFRLCSTPFQFATRRRPALQGFSSVPNGGLGAVKLGSFLTKYGNNLTKLASEGKLDPVIGRDDEISRSIQVLSRRKKNNPCLIGEPGVGKTAIAEGLAHRIAFGNVPESMKNCVIISLDLASMLAGAKFRGEFEERLKGVLKDIEQAGNRIILFIDEIHCLVGAGAAEGAIDASNILKPPLARGLLRCMGATTSEEYRKHIEKDAALARRFQTILVPEPTVEDTISILKGLRTKYEIHHGVRITDEALSAAAKLADRYMPDRRRPDKAIDLIDESASRLRILQESKPASLIALDASIADATFQLGLVSSSEGEGEQDDTNVSHVLRGQLEDLNALRQEQFDAWKSSLALLRDVNEARTILDGLSTELDRSRCESDFDKVRRLEVSTEEQKCRLEVLLTEVDKVNNGPSATLSAVEVSEIVAKNTGIPVGKLLDEERQGLLQMEVEMGKQVIGQEAAITAISKCIRLSRAGLRYHDRPLGVFLMLGPTGVGKTELAKALCQFLFQDQNAIVRIDMSEYMERFSVSRLVGAPPGYVGYEEGGVLTEAVRRRPYQVILLDEFEKAHREVSNLLLQVFDEGRLSDSHGRVADFKNTVIIMTSNLGQRELYALDSVSEQGKSPAGVSNAVAKDIIAKHFAPEFLNRIDEVITFNPLDNAAIGKICSQQLGKVRALLGQRGVEIEMSSAAEGWLSATGYDHAFGARPLKRLIQSRILDPLATLILENRVVAGDLIVVKLVDEESDMERNLISLNQDFDEVSGSSGNPIRFWIHKKT